MGIICVLTEQNVLLGSSLIYSTKISISTSTVSTSGKTIYNPTVTRNFFTNDHELSDSTDDNVTKNNDLLKNNVVITLLGVFVCFFSVFVTAYIYLKCFRKRPYESRSKETEWQAMYQSLNREAVYYSE